MRIATGLDLDGSIDETVARAKSLRERGFTSLWSSQIFGPDTLTMLALVGREVRDVDLGTAVVPIHPRHPTMLAAQARTVQHAIGGHLSLGIGLSHQVSVEGLWGLSFDRPATYMAEYLEALAPMLRGDKVDVHGERITSVTFSALGPREVATPSLLVAALGARMLDLAGTWTDGTLLWMTGVKTVAEHIVPRIREAANKAGRPEPRVVCSLPIAVTDDVEGARGRINSDYALYATLPSYAAMLEREGAGDPAGASLVGSREQVLAALHAMAAAGATEFSGVPSGNEDEQAGALEVMLDFQAGK